MHSTRHRYARRAGALAALALFCLSALSTAPTARAQGFRDSDRDRGRMMLIQIKKDLLKNYYDPAYHGVDLEARFKAANEKIDKATSNGEIFGTIAQVLVDLHDSHTFFLPPSRSASIEYGWQMEMIGDKCYVVAVKPGSDAEAKGLKPGDMVYAVDGFQPTRDNLWLLNYLYYTLRPRTTTQVIVQAPDGKSRQLDVAATVTQGKRVMDLTDDESGDYNKLILDAQNEARLDRHRYIKIGDDAAMIWKMPQFDLERREVDKMMDEARGRKALILDLRGNGGGSVETLKRLVGNFFDRSVTVCTVKRRQETKPMIAETRGGDKVFKGKLVVLVDSKSGSAAELFARVVQIEKRGTVIGDRSAGAVMQSRRYQYQYGIDTVVPYGASITDADLIMADGKSLEGSGVQPDELLVPTPKDLAAGFDPVLARAAELSDLKIDAEHAGQMFPIEWAK